ncbi:hypothetical protein RF11_07177 [Thelohanellus kitauei]|uniref:Uncharacterized protein n=1 Tax=Thelohanellus kitauei TaxID=669202 RepID=A0A0C2J8W2_THEKT|nr:hypothetical protein RF11_07177 [Thelohanellus kitauei]
MRNTYFLAFIGDQQHAIRDFDHSISVYGLYEPLSSSHCRSRFLVLCDVPFRIRVRYNTRGQVDGMLLSENKWAINWQMIANGLILFRCYTQSYRPIRGQITYGSKSGQGKNVRKENSQESAVGSLRPRWPYADRYGYRIYSEFEGVYKSLEEENPLQAIGQWGHRPGLNGPS